MENVFWFVQKQCENIGFAWLKLMTCLWQNRVFPNTICLRKNTSFRETQSFWNRQMTAKVPGLILMCVFLPLALQEHSEQCADLGRFVLDKISSESEQDHVTALTGSLPYRFNVVHGGVFEFDGSNLRSQHGYIVRLGSSDVKKRRTVVLFILRR